MKDDRVHMMKLISLIKSRKVLWNKASHRSSNKCLKRKMWEEVANNMKYSLPTIKKKWKSLRDIFRRELKKTLETNNLSTPYKPEWCYFEAMLFLKKEISLKGFKKPGVKNVDNPQEGADNDSNVFQPQNIVVAQLGEEDIFLKQRKPQPKEVRMKEEPFYTSDMDNAATPSNVEELEEERKQTVECQDEDYYFAMSLLPYMRSVPATRKLKMRMKLIQVLQDES